MTPSSRYSTMLSEEIEKIVRERGPTSISDLYRILFGRIRIGVTKTPPSEKQIRMAVKASSALEVDHDNRVVLSPIIFDNDYGHVTKKELELLRKYKCPTLQEIAIRKIEIARSREFHQSV